MTTPQEPDRVETLISEAIQLNQEVAELARETGGQFVSLARTARQNRLMIWGVIAGGVLDVILTIVLVLVGIGQQKNTDRIDRLATETQQVQTAQRQRALCPLYGIFVDSKSEEGRKRSPDPEKYDHAFEVIEEGYKFLECDQYLKESGRDKW